MKNIFLIPLLFLLALTTEPTKGSVSEPKVSWTNPVVQVCFADPVHVTESQFSYYIEEGDSVKAWDAITMDTIKSVVAANYTKKLTGISFAGWKACTKASGKKVVRLFYGEFMSHSGIATLGENAGLFQFLSPGSEPWEEWLKDTDEKLPPFAAIAFTGTRMNEFKWNILHEFGHLAALRHEHTREEARRDPHCRSPFIYLGEPIQSSTRLTGAYDPRSIMSYCLKDFAFRRGGEIDQVPMLTDGDRATLRALYP